MKTHETNGLAVAEATSTLLDAHIAVEAEMGFAENYLGGDGQISGVYKTSQCQRINHCSCDCNHSTCPILIF